GGITARVLEGGMINCGSEVRKVQVIDAEQLPQP
ncbi:MAG: hypothetical protein JWM11_8071, partial [Planctomycetaceae bacterium]|nr:hypothetical protein [Planctomycetaceae bacterium]